MSKQSKKGLMPALRFPEFRDAGGWNKDKLFELVTTVTPPKKLPTNLYQDTGKYPIIDQSKSNICGWTNDKDSLVLEELPLIIFGDHTCILKIAHEPFAQGADGIKILKAKDQVEAEFLYQALQARPVVMEEYKRHFSILKEKIVGFPKKEFGEQQKIADCLSSLDELITAHTQKHQALQSYKKGLMQNLFPAEGETLPALRFPEFGEAGEWELKPFAKFIKLYRGSSPRPIKQYLTKNENGINWIKIGDTSSISDSIIRHVSEKITPLGAEKSRKVRKGELILANSMSYGATYQLELDGCIYDGWFVLREYEDVLDKQFLLQLLNSTYMQEQYKRLAAGGIVQNISSEIVYSTLLPKPSIKEQQRIADCLSSLDDLINSQAKKIEDLKTHKKGLMQQLFPSMTEVR